MNESLAISYVREREKVVPKLEGCEYLKLNTSKVLFAIQFHSQHSFTVQRIQIFLIIEQ